LEPLPDILARIVARKREELADASNATSGNSLAELRRIAESKNADRRGFAAALKSRRPAVISEIKKASPSRGVLIEDFQPAALAQQYERGGAAALSVLTDRDFFCGSLEDLKAARAACSLPVIRKDFTIADYQVIEAAANGADAILLIVAILDDAQLRGFRDLAREFSMDALVEVHDARELDRAMASGAEIIGVNNRDLRTFQVTLETSLKLAPKMPANVVKVSESGIFGGDDVQRLAAVGFDAFLVGEHLVKSSDPAKAIGELVA
jgi:indole-3-glycerol phosphate synthase